MILPKYIKIAAARGVTIIEDNCESLGAELNGRKTGTFGLMGSFSSFFSHHISTMEGGVVLTDDETSTISCLSLRAHGWTLNLPKETRIAGTKILTISLSLSICPAWLQPPATGAFRCYGCEQVKKLDALIDGRRRNADVFQRLMANHPVLELQAEVGKSSWFGFCVGCETGSGV